MTSAPSVATWEKVSYRTDLDTLIAEIEEPFSVPWAVTHLKGYLDRPKNVAEAVAALQQLDGPHPLYRLYRKYFPLEWACSTATFSTGDGSGYSPREEEFLRLVELRLFPFDCDWTIEMAAEGGETTCVQLLPYVPNWCEDDLDLGIGWYLVLLVADVLYPDEAESRLEQLEGLTNETREGLADVIRQVNGYHLQWVRDLCAVSPPPLCELPLMLSMMRAQTGNEWLDVSGSDGSLPFDRLPLRWCEHTVDLLTRTFREAEALWQQAASLADWVELDPNAHMQLILTVFREAMTLSSEKRMLSSAHSGHGERPAHQSTFHLLSHR